MRNPAGFVLRTLLFLSLGTLSSACGQSGTSSSLPDLQVAADLTAAAPNDLAMGGDLRVSLDGAIDALPALCHDTLVSNLAGVNIRFTDQRCSFTLAEAAAGIQIGYSLVVDSDIAAVSPAPTVNGCLPAGPSGLFVMELLSGGQSSYCICDSGRCPPPMPAAITLKKGNYPAQFSWDGRNWNGPSDTNNPKGGPFPTGVYSLMLTATGTVKVAGAGVPFELKAIRDVTLRP